MHFVMQSIFFYCFAVSKEVHPSHSSNMNNGSHISTFFKTNLKSQWLCNDHLTSQTIQQSHISQPKTHKSQISVPQILQYHITQMVYTPLNNRNKNRGVRQNGLFDDFEMNTVYRYV